MEKEMFKEIAGWNGYMISDFGTVIHVYKNGKQKILIQHDNGNGYMYVQLSKNGVRKNFRVNRLVIDTFEPIDNPEMFECHHLNENRKDNRLINLSRLTRSENINAGDHNKRVAYKLSKPVIKYDLNGNFIAEYPSIKTATILTHVSRTGISMCCNGRIKTAGGYVWHFK